MAGIKKSELDSNALMQRFEKILNNMNSMMNANSNKSIHVKHEYVSLEHCSIGNICYKLRTNYLKKVFCH